MKLIAFKENGKKFTGIMERNRIVSIEALNYIEGQQWATNVVELLTTGQWPQFKGWYLTKIEKKIEHYPYKELENIHPISIIEPPQKILGIGMNYVEKAMELTGEAPKKDPVTFIKPPSSVIGPQQSIVLPAGSLNVSAEAELAIIIGERCKNLSEQEASGRIAGFIPAMDMTEKDVHAKDAKYLQWSKSFDTFCSLGSQMISNEKGDQMESIVVETLLNGGVTHTNTVGNMMYPPSFIVSFFSQFMTLNPGDVILTGTPGSNMVKPGDQAGCRISGFEPYQNQVISEEEAKEKSQAAVR